MATGLLVSCSVVGAARKMKRKNGWPSDSKGDLVAPAVKGRSRSGASLGTSDTARWEQMDTVHRVRQDGRMGVYFAK